MRLTVSRSIINGVLSAPPSKSYTHRAFVLASLAHGDSTIRRPLLSGDTQATLRGTEMMGAIVKNMGESIMIRGGGLRCPDGPIDCQNSGTTIRLLSGIASLLSCDVILTGDESLQQRPMKPLINAFHEMGVHCASLKKDGNAPLVIRGPNKGRWAHIKGNVSSQFISSLLISTPLKELDTEIVLTTPLISKPYVDITVDMMAKFGVRVDITKNGYHILGGQRYSPFSLTIPGDYSSAAYPLAAGALTGAVSVTGLDPQDKQGDKRIVDILKDMGANVSWKDDRLEVSRSPLSAVDVDMADCPDLFPIVAVLASQAQGKSRLYNAHHLRLKESDRIKTTAAFLRSLGARVEETEDGCQLSGPTALHGREVDSHGDHRILMAAAIAGMVADGRTTISDAASYEISYPSFLTDLRKAGANMEVVT